MAANDKIPFAELEEFIRSFLDVEVFEGNLKKAKKQIEDILKINDSNKKAFALHARVIKQIAANVILKNDSRLTDARKPLAHKHSHAEIEGVYSKDEISNIISQNLASLKNLIGRSEQGLASKLKTSADKIQQVIEYLSHYDFDEIEKLNKGRYEKVLKEFAKISKELEIFKKDTADKISQFAKKSDLEKLEKEWEEKLKKLKKSFLNMGGGAMPANNNTASARNTVLNIAGNGTTQAAATQLTGNNTMFEITTASGANRAVKLPVSTESSHTIIVNNTAQTILIYPATGGRINNGTVTNGFISLSPSSTVEIFGKNGADWYTEPRFSNLTDISSAIRNFSQIDTSTGSAVAASLNSTLGLFSADGVLTPQFVGSNLIYFYFNPATAALALAPYISGGDMTRSKVLGLSQGLYA